MSGPPPKPKDQASGHRTKAELDGRSTSVQLPGGWHDGNVPAWAGPPAVINLGGIEVEVPRPPARLRKAARQAWAIFWCTPEAQMLRPHHLPALRRLVRLYNDEDRIRQRVERQHLVVQAEPWGADGPAAEGEEVLELHDRAVKIPGHLGIGSTGQVVRSPDWTALVDVAERIQALEDRFAGTPLAQFRVGWQQAEMFNAQARAAEAVQLADAAAAIADRHERMLEQGGAS